MSLFSIIKVCQKEAAGENFLENKNCHFLLKFPPQFIAFVVSKNVEYYIYLSCQWISSDFFIL